MIYLIDDNKARQKDFGWTEERFSHYLNLLTPLYTIDDVIKIGENLYDDYNLILYHESFLDFTDDKAKAVEQRKKLVEKAASNNLISVGFFSGSQSSRSFTENVAYLPVAVLYRNLEVLIQQCVEDKGNLKYLLFGENPEIEQELDKILTDANKNIEIDAAIIPGKNLFIRPNLRNIQNAINGAKEVSIYPDVSDEKLSQKVSEWLLLEEYDNIFIPLCFGQTLSDFNGLRLATHIRCSESPNQLKRIFIYSFVRIEYLLQNEYFNILKTKAVELVGYSKRAFQNAASLKTTTLKFEDLPKEIKKLELQPPKNYLDNHSIANEWAIYQWAKTIGCNETDELIQVFKNVESNLYFKYLKTINPISENDRISRDKLKINYAGKPKVLLIDDEAEKGWYEIFAYLLGDINDIYTDYLWIDFKNLGKDEIIEKSIFKIINDDIDVVILDFRLSPSDFENKNIEDNTSIKLLKEIKRINPGIQIIAFSATNKVWNLQSMREAGADGFILKGSPGNIINNKFIVKYIESFLVVFFELTQKLFLKDFYNNINKVKKNILNCDFDEESEFKNFINELTSQIKLIEEAAKNINPKFSITLDVVFLNCYNFIERFKIYYLKEINFRYYIGIEEIELNRYEYVNNKIIKIGPFARNGANDKPSWFQSIVGILIDYFRTIDVNHLAIQNLHEIKNARNNYIHEKKLSFSKSDLNKILGIMMTLTSFIKE